MAMRHIRSNTYTIGELALNRSSPYGRVTDLHKMFTISFLCADNPHPGCIQVVMLFLPYPFIFYSIFDEFHSFLDCLASPSTQHPSESARTAACIHPPPT